MAKVIAVYSMKGGVGKSSLAVNLADGWARSGGRVLLWDVDAQGAASFLLGQVGNQVGKGGARKIFSRAIDPGDVVEETQIAGLDLIAADVSLRHLDASLAEDSPKRLRKLLGPLADDYAYIVLDCPPGLGQVAEQIFRAADILVVPLVPSPLAVRTLEQVREQLAEARGKKAPAVLPVFSMVDKRRALHREMLDAHPDWPAIPQASVVEMMGMHRAPLAAFAAKSVAAKAYGQVLARVTAALGGCA